MPTAPINEFFFYVPTLDYVALANELDSTGQEAHDSGNSVVATPTSFTLQTNAWLRLSLEGNFVSLVRKKERQDYGGH